MGALAVDEGGRKQGGVRDGLREMPTGVNMRMALLGELGRGWNG